MVCFTFDMIGQEVSSDKKYAEYWMGSHVNGPSTILIDGQDINLLKYLSNQNMEGLPFLFKVLSIEDPLSIQVHPDKKFAEVLFKEDPTHYRDDNHKPEMAIVISPEFSLLYGLVPINKANQLASLIISKNILPAESEIFKAAYSFQNQLDENSYKNLILAIVNLKEEESKGIVTLLKSNLDSFSQSDNHEIKQKFGLLSKLIAKFGNDKGVLFALFMNLYVLKFGDALFIRPNLPHAYIHGDCMELMANSDNVIRLGLTPKFVDTANFEKVIFI